MKKRLIALLLLAVLILPTAACDGGQNPADTSPDTTAPEATAEPTAPADTPPATDPATDPETDPETTAPETEPETEPPLGTVELDKSKTYKILFIGNIPQGCSMPSCRVRQLKSLRYALPLLWKDSFLPVLT